MTRRAGCMIVGVIVVVAHAAAQTGIVESDKDSTVVTYWLDHPLHRIEATSKEAVFHAEIDTVAKKIRSVSADVDVMSFDSGNSNRDSHAMEVIDAITYPNASFSSTTIDTAGDSLRVSGVLTFHGLSKPVVAAVVPSWSAHALNVRGGFTVSLTAFRIDRPSLLMIPVSDSLHFTMNVMFRIR